MAYNFPHTFLGKSGAIVHHMPPALWKCISRLFACLKLYIFYNFELEKLERWCNRCRRWTSDDRKEAGNCLTEFQALASALCGRKALIHHSSATWASDRQSSGLFGKHFALRSVDNHKLRKLSTERLCFDVFCWFQLLAIDQSDKTFRAAYYDGF